MAPKKCKKKLAAGDCVHCPALCCRYIMTEIDRPIYKDDFEDIRWYVAHENITVVYDDNRWFLYVLSPCTHLTKDNRCDIYASRPSLCRKYSTLDCDFIGEEEFDLHLHNIAEVDEYVRKRWGNKKSKSSAKKQTHHATRHLPTVYLRSVQVREPRKKK